MSVLSIISTRSDKCITIMITAVWLELHVQTHWVVTPAVVQMGILEMEDGLAVVAMV